MKLIVCPLAQLDAALALAPSHVLTLLAPDAETPPCPGIAPAQRLVLNFNDINGPTDGLTHASSKDIENLIAFAQSWRGPAPFVAHCWAGISRSTAAAYIISCLRHEPGTEQDLAEQLRRIAPWATPNPWMVALADKILGRSGHMTKAIAAIGRGREAGQGELFTLELPG
jgi:predicted protein tyrosine phosphatase